MTQHENAAASLSEFYVSLRPRWPAPVDVVEPVDASLGLVPHFEYAKKCNAERTLRSSHCRCIVR